MGDGLDLRAPRTRRTLATASVASVLAHLALGALVLWSLKPVPQQDYAPRATDITLLAPILSPRRVQREHPRSPRAAPRSALTPDIHAAGAPAAPAAQPSPFGARVAAQDNLGKVLRQSVRCAHPDDFAMDPAERDWCRQAARSRTAGAPTYAALPANPSAAAALDHERRVSEAWRNYHNSYRTDDHPGLASMFGGGDPCPPGPVCWHPIGH